MERIKKHVQELQNPKAYYETNRKINLLIISAGVVLLANSID
jgi:Skp family chaperone for outer membrane proteins